MTVHTTDPNEASRIAARQAAIDANAAMSWASSDQDAQARHLAWRSVDPFPDIPSALLNSADIANYVEQTGLMYPFDASKLKSASYEVPLLGPYVYIDRKGKRREGVLERGQEIRVPKNSITFLTVEPYLRLPDYIALRHNLKIDHVYKGLLVGTGPLIDPGFVGRLSLPLHNLTENDYTFVGGDGVIWVEFTKLSPLPNAVGATAAPPATGTYVSFNAGKTKERLVSGYVRSAVGSGDVPASSSAGISRTATNAKRTVNTVTTFGALGTVAFVLTLLGVLVLPQIGSLKGDLERREDQIVEQQSRLNELERKLNLLEGIRQRDQPNRQGQ